MTPHISIRYYQHVSCNENTSYIPILTMCLPRKLYPVIIPMNNNRTQLTYTLLCKNEEYVQCCIFNVVLTDINFKQYILIVQLLLFQFSPGANV